MRIPITREPLSTPTAHNALTALLNGTRTLTTIFLTVGAPYKPVRYSRSFCDLPDRYAAQGQQALRLLLGVDPDTLAAVDVTIPRRKEWTYTALLVPLRDAPPLDGRTIATFASAQLIVWYGVGRCAGLLYSSEHDAAGRAALAAMPWQVLEHPRPWRRLRTRCSLPAWQGMPSLFPVPILAEIDEVPSAATGPTARLDPAVPHDADMARWLRTDVVAAASQPELSSNQKPVASADTMQESHTDRLPRASAEQGSEDQPYEHTNGSAKAC